jgi:hypothetical protein
MTRRRVVILAAAAILGCNKNSTGPAQGVSSSCTVNLSGAISGTYDCRPATTSWSGTTDDAGFSFGVRASGTEPVIGLAIVWLGEPADTTYHNTDAGAQADISVTSGNQTWLATVGEGPPAAGTYSLTFSSVVINSSAASGKLYATDGTVTATLPAVTATGASGVVILSATF